MYLKSRRFLVGRNGILPVAAPFHVRGRTLVLGVDPRLLLAAMVWLRRCRREI
jgi:hypothetical protein